MYNRPRPQSPSNWRRPHAARRPRTSQVDPSLFIKRATATVAEQYEAKHTFADFGLQPLLLDNIRHHGYVTPSPIQDQAIPVVKAGRDIIGIAQTGTGKTAAFLLPLIDKIAADPSQKVLIIIPTRELAVQIRDELLVFTRGMNIFSTLCIGGVSIRPQMNSLRRNPHFIIGTPGRLKDLEQQKYIRFSDFTTIVLDEVDRMLDMGFVRDIQYIVAKLPEVRHSLFFSATLPGPIQDILRRFVKDPVTVSVKKQESSDRVNQDIVKINGKPKIEVLHELLIQKEFEKVLLFGRTKYGIEKLSNELLKRGFRVAAIHGDKRQSQRQRALDDFKNNRIQVLLATDIASRGIDVRDVSHVINFDAPQSYEDYIHRIGRTGRADKFGTALTFVD